MSQEDQRENDQTIETELGSAKDNYLKIFRRYITYLFHFGTFTGISDNKKLGSIVTINNLSLHNYINSGGSFIVLFY